MSSPAGLHTTIPVSYGALAGGILLSGLLGAAVLHTVGVLGLAPRRCKQPTQQQQAEPTQPAIESTVPVAATPAEHPSTVAVTAAAEPVAAAASAAPSTSTTAAKAVASRRARSSKKAKKLKMVLCVRNDLQMGKGKMMAQCCHAAVGVVKEIIDDEDEDLMNDLEQWDENGAMKIALKVNSEEDLDTFEAKADELGLPNYLVIDAGHTQIAPDTKTVLAIGPADAAVIDKLTGHLKLM